MAYPGSFYDQDIALPTGQIPGSYPTPGGRRSRRTGSRGGAMNFGRGGNPYYQPGPPSPPSCLPPPVWASCIPSINQGNNEGGEEDSNVDVVSLSPPAPRGSRLEIKRVDEVYDPYLGRWNVQEGYKEPEAADKVEPFAEYAFLLWRKITPSPNPACPPSIETSIDVKSKHLRTICKDVIGDFMGISWTAEPLKVDPKAFIAYLPKLKARVEELDMRQDLVEEESMARDHLKFLIEFIREEFADKINEINAYLSHGEITFDLLWAILLPRTPLYTKCLITGEPRAVWLEVAQLQSCGTTFYELQSECVEYNAHYHQLDADGNEPKFGIAKVEISPIWAFRGAVKIKNLPSYPLQYHPNEEKLKSRLLVRGKKWLSLQGMHHMYYSGNAHYQTASGQMAKLHIDSRIMVDWKTLEEINPNFTLPDVTKGLNFEDLEKNETSYDDDDESAEKKPEPDVILDDTQLTFTSPIVYGFSFSDKRWLRFNVNHVKTFEWNDEPFANLVLPPATKSLIKALVEKHTSPSGPGFDDFVHGKGQGLVINLFGSPGVGKTLTAEATSEQVRKPLYVVGAGDLGTEAHGLDAELTRIFSVASKWGAVVLIDEADVFLEERSLQDLFRNAMVAVFLRQLEYFRGILFLTTNRVRTFDEAFQSRIHVSLRYHDLDAAAKRQIWVAFISKVHTSSGVALLPSGGLSEAQLKELGDKKVNGRQIKNVVRTATAVADGAHEILGYKHLVQVLDILDQFEMDWNAIQRN